MENPVIPAAAAWPVLWVFANYVEHRLRRAQDHRFGILRHEKHVAALFEPDFADKFRKAFSTGQIESTARLASVPVSTGNEQSLPMAGQIYDTIIFFPATCSIEFKGMQKSDIALQ